MMKKRLILASLLLVMNAIPLLAIAEDEPASIADMWVVTPKAGQQAEFEAALTAHLAFRAGNGDTRNWQTFTIVAGGDELGEYFIRHCCFTWPDQDAYLALEKDKGYDEHWSENVDQFVKSYKHIFQEIDWDNSQWPEDAGDFSLFGVTNWTPKPGHGAQRRAAMAAFTKTTTEHVWDHTWSWSWSIGGPDRLSLVMPYKNFADMVPPEQTFYAFMIEHHGEEAAAEIFNNFSSSFWESGYTIYRHRSELSMSGDDD
jgi:hypothetical protein